VGGRRGKKKKETVRRRVFLFGVKTKNPVQERCGFVRRGTLKEARGDLN